MNGNIKINGGKFYYEFSGSGDTVVFVHGFSLSHKMWDFQKELLSDSFRILTYDMRGFGQSSNPTGVYSHHRDLKNLLDALKVSKAHIVGLSLGGGVALDFVLEYPKYARSLLVADSSLGGFVSTVDWNTPTKEKTIEKARQVWLNHEVFEFTRKNKEVLSRLKEIVNRYDGWHWFNDDPRQKAQPLAIERLSEINIPTSILVGEYDLDYFHNIAKVLKQKISNSELYIIKRAGHMVNMEKPEKFNELLISLIEKERNEKHNSK